MAEDTHVRITLRIPKDLHEKLDAAATASSKSLNAQIVEAADAGLTWKVQRLTYETRLQEAMEEHARLLSKLGAVQAPDDAIDVRMLARTISRLELDLANLELVREATEGELCGFAAWVYSVFELGERPEQRTKLLARAKEYADAMRGKAELVRLTTDRVNEAFERLDPEDRKLISARLKVARERMRQQRDERPHQPSKENDVES